MATLIAAASLFAPGGRASGEERGHGSAPPANGSTNAFPDLNEVFQGRAFKTTAERDVFFLRRIREAYPEHWGALLGANIIVSDYVQAPEKLLRFVEALGTALAGTDDLTASTCLAAITSDPAFHANTNAYRPEILRAAAGALIKIGPKGRQALADSFSEGHYRTDSVSLEVLAEAVGEAGVSDARLTAALDATAFRFTATNGGCYPRCTKQVTRNLLCLPGGMGAVATHLKAKEVFNDPGRLQAVVEGIASARAVGLATNLVEVAREVAAKLDALAGSPGVYRDALLEYQASGRRTIEQLRENDRRANKRGAE